MILKCFAVPHVVLREGVRSQLIITVVLLDAVVAQVNTPMMSLCVEYISISSRSALECIGALTDLSFPKCTSELRIEDNSPTVQYNI